MCPNYFDQLFGALGAGSAFTIRIDNMLPDMVFDDLGHETVHCPACRDNQVKYLSATFFLIDSPLKRVCGELLILAEWEDEGQTCQRWRDG